MARIRTVKPELFRHEALFEAEAETGLPLRLAFIGLFTVADREGIFRWQPRQIKLDVMPYDSHDFSRVLDALMTRGFIVKYACANELYGVIPSFKRHQVINNREKTSDFPHIDDADEVFDSVINDITTREARVDDASITPLVQEQGEGKGRELEGKGKGRGTTSPRVNGSGSISAGEMIDSLPGLSIHAAEEYRGFRKAKKAPLTAGAWKTIVKEIGKSGMSPDDALNTAMARGWQGFDSSWLTSNRGMAGGMINRQQQIEENNARVVKEIIAREHGRAGQSGFDLGEAITIEGEVIHAN